jgi:hypothetical protein
MAVIGTSAIGTNVTGKCGDNRGFGVIRFLVRN